MTSQRRQEDNSNYRNRSRYLETRSQQARTERPPFDKPKTPKEDSPGSGIGADHLAILFVCQQGWQTLSVILRGVNATRVPIGKAPLREADVLALLTELENRGFLNKIELRGRPAWTATQKGRDVET
jgi:hypothetical protein